MARLLPLLACLYLPFIGGGFLTDDFRHLKRLNGIDSTMRLVDSPDVFSFYRPLAQASIALDLRMHGPRPARLRATNVALQAIVIGLAFYVAQLILGSPFAAALATLAFALTPKAHPIAVLWISARAELLVSLFSLAAIAAWIKWTRGGSGAWLAGATVAFALALLSKETATLLPLVLLFTPRAERGWTPRIGAVVMLLALMAGTYAWRIHVGALTPFTEDPHYTLLTPMSRWMMSVVNYVPRMVTAPIGLVVIFFAARLLSPRQAVEPVHSTTHVIEVVVFALAWIVVFLAPVVPIVARSELYLYLPVFGLCLLAGLAAETLVRGVTSRQAIALASGIFVISFGAYQVSRAFATHRNLLFSERLVVALQNNTELQSGRPQVVLVPSDTATEQILRDTIGGYLDEVLWRAFGNETRAGFVQYQDEARRTTGLRLGCEYREPDVILAAIQ